MDRHLKRRLVGGLVFAAATIVAAQGTSPVDGDILYDMGVVIKKGPTSRDSLRAKADGSLVDSLQQRIAKLEEQLDYYQKAFAAAKAKLKHSQAVIDSLYQAQEDLKLTLRTDLAALRKQLEGLKQKQAIRITEAEKSRPDSLSLKADSLLAELLPARYPKILPEAKNVLLLSPEEEQSLYRRAVSRYNRGHIHSALEDFRVLRSRATTPRLKASAQYWIGRGYFEQGYYDLAVDALDEVLRMPQAHERDAAMMLLGMALHNLGREAEAQRVYRTLIRMYPDSEYAPFARRFARRSQEREP